MYESVARLPLARPSSTFRSVALGRPSSAVHPWPLPRPLFRIRRGASAAVHTVGSSIGSSQAAGRVAVQSWREGSAACAGPGGLGCGICLGIRRGHARSRQHAVLVVSGDHRGWCGAVAAGGGGPAVQVRADMRCRNSRGRRGAGAALNRHAPAAWRHSCGCGCCLESAPRLMWPSFLMLCAALAARVAAVRDRFKLDQRP